MMKKELVSIITPTYNSELYIGYTIESIQRQTYDDWELLITDDASTDNTVSVIESFIRTDRRIKLFKQRINEGAGIARNNSIKRSNGKYIAFCDSDDLWLPNKLEKQLKFIKNHNLSFTYSSYFTQDENWKKNGSVYAPSNICYKEILRNNYIGCLTALYDVEKLGKVYFPSIRKRQDWVLWINIIERLGIVQGISEPLAIYTVRKNSISRNKLNLIKYTWDVYHKALNFSLVKSVLYMVQFLYFYARKKIKN